MKNATELDLNIGVNEYIPDKAEYKHLYCRFCYEEGIKTRHHHYDICCQCGECWYQIESSGEVLLDNGYCEGCWHE